MTGIVNVRYEAILEVEVQGPSGRAQLIKAIVDTGYNGALSMPIALVAGLALPFQRRGRALLADGSLCSFDIYEAVVIWDGQPRRIAVDVAEAHPLIGMRLLRGCELTLQAVPEGASLSQRFLRA